MNIYELLEEKETVNANRYLHSLRIFRGNGTELGGILHGY